MTRNTTLVPASCDDALIYRGERQYDWEVGGLSVLVTVSDRDGIRHLDPRLDIRDHSPTGLEWGYLGSGPAQLALAILADYLGDDELANSLYQTFKFQVVSRFPKDGWELIPSDIEAFLRHHPTREWEP